MSFPSSSPIRSLLAALALLGGATAPVMAQVATATDGAMGVSLVILAPAPVLVIRSLRVVDVRETEGRLTMDSRVSVSGNVRSRLSVRSTTASAARISVRGIDGSWMPLDGGAEVIVARSGSGDSVVNVACRVEGIASPERTAGCALAYEISSEDAERALASMVQLSVSPSGGAAQALLPPAT